MSVLPEILMLRAFLDSSAGSVLIPEVREAMVAAMGSAGNPSSIHAEGRSARQALTRARGDVAALINAKADEVAFVSCGTEANNWALRGLLAANKRKGNHLVISSVEHPSLSLPVKRLEREGWDVSYLPVDRDGAVSPNELAQALRKDTVLVSVMHANGEVGTIQPIAELAKLARAQGALFHADAIASAGYAPIDVRALGVDALTLTSNAFHGPSGAGALYLRNGARILPLLEGGGQEAGNRSGTEPLIAAVGMGAACAWVRERVLHDAPRLAALRDRLREGLSRQLTDIQWNGSWQARLPQNLHACIRGVASESLILGLDQVGIAAGIGSACNAKAMRPSHVLKAMGLSDDEAQGAIVWSLGWLTTPDEIEQAIERIPPVVEQLRRITAMTRHA